MKRPFGIAGIIYLTVSWILLSHLQYFSDNPDTFQYISIAKKYLHFDWSHAINEYWSPLISWLLVIPIAVFDDSVTAFKMLQLAIGIFVLFQWSKILTSSRLSVMMQFILAILSVPFLISYALLNCTPDFLFMGMILWLINVFVSGNVSTEPGIAIRAGIVGGFMYFTKAFGLPLFVAISIVAILFERRKEKTNFRTITIMYLVFTAMSAVWISKISFHYGEFTVSKTIAFNSSLSTNALLGNEELPVLGSGIIKPNEGEISAWESPGDHVSVRNGNNFVETLKRNLLAIYYFDFSRQIGIIFLLLLCMYVYRKGKEMINDKWILLLLSAMLFIYGGYSLILVHSRYLWVNTFIMLVVSSVFIQQLINNRAIKTIVYSLFFLLAIKRPLKEIFFISDKDYPASQLVSAILHPFETLEETYNIDSEIQKSIRRFQKIRLPKSNFASLKPGNYSRDTYTTSLKIVESLDAKYFGEIKDVSDSLLQAMKQNQIDYLISYEDVPGLRKLLNEDLSGIRIYYTEKKAN